MSVRDLFTSGTTPAARPFGLPRIAIIGRGFSGLMTAVALINTIRVPFHLQLFDPNPSISGGQALASAQSSEILNSRVRDLSVSAGDPDDFNDWLLANESFRAAVPAAIPGFQQIFVPKSIFSDYVYQRFSQALAERRDISVQFCPDPVTAVTRLPDGRFRVDSAAAGSPLFDTVMLATGFGVRPALPDSGQAEDRRTDAASDTSGPVVLLGSGLRVVDRLLQLRDGGFDGPVTILSRHGFLPQSHTRKNADPLFPDQPLPTRLSEVLRFVRAACDAAEAEGKSWQSVMNGLRKHARSLWRSLPARQKQQFNRHLRALYDSHRNRLPEALHLRLQAELAAGRTQLRKGRVGTRTETGLVFRPAGQGHEEIIAAGQVIDCRCPAPDLRAPLLQGLITTGLAVPDELGLGLAVNAAGELLVGGRVSDGLFAIGPLGLGSLPDIDLVPEIVSQAYASAARIATRFYPHSQAV